MDKTSRDSGNDDEVSSHKKYDRPKAISIEESGGSIDPHM